MAGRVPQGGRMSLSPMLTHKGKLDGDLTISCLDEETFLVIGSGAAQEMHRRWFEQHISDFEVTYRNCSDEFHGIAISGPRSRDLLKQITRKDGMAETMKFMAIRRTFAGGVPVVLARISFTGELGYEIYCAPQYQLKLFEEIEAAGSQLGLKWYGARALMSLRLEKNWGVWTLDFRPDFTAHEAGLDIFIDWEKDFIGKQATLVEKKTEPVKKLVTMTIETQDIDVVNDEAVLKDGNCVGYVSSGGFAHHLKKSMAMGYVPPELSSDGTTLEVEINGEFYPATVIARPLYDAGSAKMRS